METIDDDVAARAADFIERSARAEKPFFVWVNFTHMHFRTHTKPESLGQAGRGQSPYHDTMIDHDRNVGTVLDKLDELGLADDTIVMYSTDSGQPTRTMAASINARALREIVHRRSESHAAAQTVTTRSWRYRTSAGRIAWRPSRAPSSSRVKNPKLMRKPTFAQILRRSWKKARLSSVSPTTPVAVPEAALRRT